MSAAERELLNLVPDQHIRKLSRIGVDLERQISRGQFGHIIVGNTNENAVRLHVPAIALTDDITLEKYIDAVRDQITVESLGRRRAAVKLLSLPTDADIARYNYEVQEAFILSNLSHPNIIQVLDSVIIERRLYIVMEYAPDGDLRSLLRSHRKGRSLAETTAKNIVKQLFEGLLYIHDRHLSHGDVHEGNVLLFLGNKFLLKYVDFGLSRFLGQETTVNNDIRRLGHIVANVSSCVGPAGHEFGRTLHTMAKQLQSGGFGVNGDKTLRNFINEYWFVHPIEYLKLNSWLIGRTCNRFDNEELMPFEIDAEFEEFETERGGFGSDGCGGEGGDEELVPFFLSDDCGGDLQDF